MKWLKYGLFGCLGLMGILLVLAGAVTGLAWQRAGSMEAEEKILTRDLSARAEPPALDPEALAADMPAAPEVLEPSGAGRVILDLSQASFYIEPGQPGDPLRVEASFDSDYYVLEESFDEAGAEPWSYRIRFKRSTPSSLITRLGEIISGSSPKVRIFLPVDVPLDLELDLERGGMEAELGGLWLRSADLEFGMGGMNLEIDEPLREPLESLAIQGRMGGANLRGLGNASPRRLEVDYSMGGMHLDLRGRWVADSRISIKHRMGGGAITLPDGVIIEGLGGGRDGPRGDAGADAPTLTFELSSEMGELEIVN